MEFTHPQWPTGDECPPEWSHLPSVAMPDGSHNYHQETVYFHLPPIEGSDTVYGVSCYRQIDADVSQARHARQAAGIDRQAGWSRSRRRLFGGARHAGAVQLLNDPRRQRPGMEEAS